MAAVWQASGNYTPFFSIVAAFWSLSYFEYFCQWVRRSISTTNGNVFRIFYGEANSAASDNITIQFSEPNSYLFTLRMMKTWALFIQSPSIIMQIAIMKQKIVKCVSFVQMCVCGVWCVSNENVHAVNYWLTFAIIWMRGLCVYKTHSIQSAESKCIFAIWWR